jgi:hypothetical protein
MVLAQKRIGANKVAAMGYPRRSNERDLDSENATQGNEIGQELVGFILLKSGFL